MLNQKGTLRPPTIMRKNLELYNNFKDDPLSHELCSLAASKEREREEREEFANSQVRSVTFELDMIKSTERD